MPNFSTPISSRISNYILGTLPSEEIERLRPHLEPIQMTHGKILFDVGDPISHVYFPTDAMISVVASTASGQTAESGVIGWEGFGGVEAIMGDDDSLNRHIIQLPGEGLRLPISVAKEEFNRNETFQKLTLAFIREMMAQMSQTALCNRLHVAEERLAKWLLMCHDRAPGDVLQITQEFAALMLGSNRVSVTQAAIAIQEQGLIEYSRGKITILNRPGLEAYTCECYARIQEEFDRLTS